VSAADVPVLIPAQHDGRGGAEHPDIVAIGELGHLIPLALTRAARLTAAEYAAVALLRPDRSAYASYHHLGDDGAVVELGPEEIRETPILASLRLTDAPFRVDALGTQPALTGFPPGQMGAACLLTVPLQSNRQMVGHLLLARSRLEPFGPDEEADAGAVAAAIAAAVVQLRADEQLAALRARSQRLARTNLALMRQLRPEGVLQWAVNDVRAILEAEAAAVLMPAAPAGEGGAFVRSGVAPGRKPVMPLLEASGSGLLARALRLPGPLRLSDLHRDPVEIGFPEGGAPITSFIAAPLIRNRKTLGLLYAVNKRRAPQFSEEDERFLRGLAAELARSRLLTPVPGPPELVDRIAAASTQLRSEMEATRSFLANLSHELRSSISGILMSAELLKDPALGVLGSDERVVAVATRIHSVAGNLLGLVDNLLDLGRLEAGRLDVRSQPVDLSSVVGDVDEVIAPLAVAGGVTLEWPTFAQVPRLVADPIRLRQVLVNLFTNAVKFTPAGGRAWLEVSVDGTGVTLAVCDTGRGIPASETERIFQPFERASISDVPGVGLGLAICRRILELHGSTLQVSSEPGKGSRFSWTLRRSREPLPPRLLRPVRRAGGEPVGAASVLVVEDDPVNRQSVIDILVGAGHRVRSVATRAAALEAVTKSPADVVVLDVQLPDGNGLEIVDRLRSASGGAVVAVVALSADRVGNTAELAMEAGCDRFGLKPIPAATLLAMVTEALSERQAMAEAARALPPRLHDPAG
jgi:signal transduction histidine kinase/ActR/RegA family two-component response regulator